MSGHDEGYTICEMCSEDSCRKLRFTSGYGYLCDGCLKICFVGPMKSNLEIASSLEGWQRGREYGLREAARATCEKCTVDDIPVQSDHSRLWVHGHRHDIIRPVCGAGAVWDVIYKDDEATDTELRRVANAEDRGEI